MDINNRTKAKVEGVSAEQALALSSAILALLLLIVLGV